MERSASNIGRAKFCKQPAPRRHKILAALAHEHMQDGDLVAFLERYEEMQRWSELDRYQAPSWLSPQEALSEFARFHEGFSGKQLSEDRAGETVALTWTPRFPVTVVLDQVRTPYNCGSILRLIDNFGFARLVHATAHLRLSHAKLKRAARGVEAWIPTKYEPDLPGWLKRQDKKVIGLEIDPNATPLNEWQPPRECILVVGNEAYGIAQSIRDCCDELVAVPTFGFKNSMNLSHAFAVAAHHYAGRHTE